MSGSRGPVSRAERSASAGNVCSFSVRPPCDLDLRTCELPGPDSNRDSVINSHVCCRLQHRGPICVTHEKPRAGIAF